MLKSSYKPLYKLFIKEMNSNNLTEKKYICKNIFYKTEKKVNITNSILFKVYQELKKIYILLLIVWRVN